ncbi:MAG TPA: transglycosylase domain-containing protein [Solirubrobacterales bacterium]|nr:transglycosylase domain-containing protein [Solirubrobacterales bacterium]
MTQRGRRRQRRRGSVGTKVAIVAGVLLAVIAIAVIGVTSWVLNVAADAPSLASCKQAGRHGNSVIYAADGERLGAIASPEARIPIAFSKLPRKLELATVAIEDQRFYQHGGLDTLGILRAAVTDLEAGEAVEGGSTITQQLVRNLCIEHPKKTLERKIEEAKLALEYSEHHSKRQILGQYLNTATYGTVAGSTMAGVGAAARIYFSRPVWKLDVAQLAMLAGLPQAPSEYNPLLNPRAAKARRNEVLRKMAKLGYLPPARARALERRGLGLDVDHGFFAHREPYFFDYVEHLLIQHYGAREVRRGGLQVHTTLSPELQRVGRAAIAETLYEPTDPASAFVSIDPRNGDIRAMVNSTDYAHDQFNLAAQGHRQPGSTFKAFVLTTAIKQGIDPYSTYYESKPLDLNLPQWGHWEVHTADEGYQGTINLKQATVTSDNTVFAQLDLDVGPENVAATAKSMGITTHLQGLPAEGIGGLKYGVSPLELSDAYATLASGGIRRRPVAIDKVVLPGGKVDHPQSPQPKRVLSPAVAWQVTRLLRDNITEGTGTAAYTGCVGQAGKTGTTDNETDAWFSGYQPNLATAVWVGYPESNAISMTDVHGIVVFGGTFPAEIWHSVYSNAGVPCEEFHEPEEQIEWSPGFGQFTAPAPGTEGAKLKKGKGGKTGGGAGEEELPGQGAVDGYNPNAYAPGVGQEPAPLPPPLPPKYGGPEPEVDGSKEAPK